MVWTYDPLVRRNGWFNVVKLRARAVAYYPNLYGVMEDELNGTDETDRCLVSWDIGPVGRSGGTGEPEPAPAPPLAPTPMLAMAESGGPAILDGDAADRPGVAAVLCQVPDDIVTSAIAIRTWRGRGGWPSGTRWDGPCAPASR